MMIQPLPYINNGNDNYKIHHGLEHIMQHNDASPALPFLAAPRRFVRCSLPAMLALRRSRRALTTLSDAQLCDAGISPADAQAEAARPVWDAPASWKR